MAFIEEENQDLLDFYQHLEITSLFSSSPMSFELDTDHQLYWLIPLEKL